MSNNNNMYNILGKLKSISDTSALTPDTPATPLYESVEPRGSIAEAVKSLESKYETFKESAKPDFLDVDKDGDKKEPIKKAVKDKAKTKTIKEYKSAAKTLPKEYRIENNGEDICVQEKQPGGWVTVKSFNELSDDWANTNAREYMAMLKKRAADDKVEEEKADLDESFEDRLEAAREKAAAAGKTKEKEAPKSNVRTVKGQAYGGSKQKDAAEKDDLDETTTATGGEVTRKGNVTTHKGKKYGGEREYSNREDAIKKDIWDLKRPGNAVDVGDAPDELDEVAPPGAKAERMVKHVKKGYSDDGKLTKREKGIAYATAWKAHNKGQVEEGTEFKDAGKIKNSAPNMKKAKPAMVKESRVMEETDYFYEKVAKSLCSKNPNLNTSTGEFEMAVRKEMVAQGIEPNRARNILLMDEDFLMDVASAYGHYCKELTEYTNTMTQAQIPSPTSAIPVTKELDEISKLAGLPVRETEVYDAVNHEESLDNIDEATGSAVTLNGKSVNVATIEVDGVNDWDRPDFVDAYITYAEFSDGTPLSDDELDQLTDEHGDLVNQAAHSSLEGAGDFSDYLDEEGDDFPAPPPEKNYVLEKEMGEGDDFPAPPPEKNYVLEKEMGEGNEFSGALAAAKAAGKKDFEVDGKRYTVKEDVTLMADGDDVVNLIRKLAGMDTVEAEPAPMPIATPIAVSAEPAEEMPSMIDAVEVDEERDIEYVNTPREKTAGLAAAIPSGDDMHRAKKSYSDKPYRGDNPMAVKEESLWKAYKSMIRSVKK